MWDFLKGLFLVCLLMALGASGWMNWLMWNENRTLQQEKTELEAERVRLKVEGDLREGELKRVEAAKEALGRDLIASISSCEKAKGEVAQLKSVRDEAVKELAAARQEAKADAARVAAAVPAGVPKPTVQPEASRIPDEKPPEEVGGESLRQLIDLTNKAMDRRAGTP